MTTASIATSLVACFIQLICLMSRPMRTMLRVTKRKCVLLFGMNRLKHRKTATSVRISCWCGNFAVNPEKCENSKSSRFNLVLKFLRLGLRKAVGNWDEISSRPWCPRHILPKTDIEETVTEWSVTDLGDVSAIAIKEERPGCQRAPVHSIPGLRIRRAAPQTRRQNEQLGFWMFLICAMICQCENVCEMILNCCVMPIWRIVNIHQWFKMIPIPTVRIPVMMDDHTTSIPASIPWRQNSEDANARRSILAKARAVRRQQRTRRGQIERIYQESGQRDLPLPPDTSLSRRAWNREFAMWWLCGISFYVFFIFLSLLISFICFWGLFEIIYYTLTHTSDVSTWCWYDVYSVECGYRN